MGLVHSFWSNLGFCGFPVGLHDAVSGFACFRLPGLVGTRFALANVLRISLEIAASISMRALNSSNVHARGAIAHISEFTQLLVAPYVFRVFVPLLQVINFSWRHCPSAALPHFC